MHRTFFTFSSSGKSDAGRACVQVQMAAGFLHSPFNPTAAVTRLIKGAGVSIILPQTGEHWCHSWNLHFLHHEFIQSMEIIRAPLFLQLTTTKN